MRKITESTLSWSLTAGNHLVSVNGILAYCLRGQKEQGWGYQPQSLAFDNTNASIYIVQQHHEDEAENDGFFYISRFSSNGVVNQQPQDYMQTPNGFGHQGLAVFGQTDSPTIIAPAELEGNVLTFEYVTDGSEPLVTTTAVFEAGAVTVGQNEDCSLLAFRQDAASGNNVIVVDTFSFISTPDNPYIKYEIQLTSNDYALQAMTILGEELHVISSAYELYESLIYDVYDLPTGQLIYHSSNVTIGADDAYASGSHGYCDGYYEAEGLCVKDGIPHILISSGDSGREQIRIYQLSPSPYPREQKVYAQLASSFAGIAADEQITKIKSTITKLYRTGLAQKLSHFFIFNAPTEAVARINWLDPFNEHLTSQGNGMTFTPNQGYKATGVTTDYLMLGRGMISELAPIDRGCASFGLICDDVDGERGYLVNSSGGSILTNFRFNPRDNEGKYSVGIFGELADTATIGQYSGFSVINRERDTVSFYNKSELVSSENIGFSTPGDYYITLGGGIDSSTRNIKMFCAGGTLSDEEVKILGKIVDYASSIFSTPA